MTAESILLHDDFMTLRTGAVKEHIDGPFREMHAQAASPEDNLDGWSRRFGWWTLPKDPWTVVETAKGRALESSATASAYDNVWLAKGEADWQDVRVETTVTLLPMGDGWGGPAGVLFRFMDSRRHYAACIDADGLAKLLRRDGNAWDVLATSPIDVAGEGVIEIIVEAKGSQLRAHVANARLEADDATFRTGCIGFIGARPARFGPVTVSALEGEEERLIQLRAAASDAIRAKRSRFGKAVVWKKIDTEGFGSGRRIRLGDLTGDGRPDFLLLQVDVDHPPAISCMSALSAAGEMLWQRGTPSDPPRCELSADTPAQIHDIDADGRCEVVCAWGEELLILDGATGSVKQRAPLPAMSPLSDLFKKNMLDWGEGFSDEGPRLRASAIAFADLAGRGRPSDILLCDPYHTLVALGPDLRELWRSTASHGHFPQSNDFDGDGRDDVLAGYERLSPDGKLLGRVCLQDHQDAIYVGRLNASQAGPVRILMAGGEDGLLALTPEYDIGQRVMGHVQRLSIGRFRQDVEGLCVAICLYHGNPGIVSLFDSTLKRMWQRDFPVIGTTLQPVNWDGSGIEQMLLSGIRPSQGYAGGLIDGEGELVVSLPDDGGPGLCAFAHDFDDDGIDELMLWDHERIWIYHSDSDPLGAYRPERPPLWNSSNFQSYWSHPR